MLSYGSILWGESRVTTYQVDRAAQWGLALPAQSTQSKREDHKICKIEVGYTVKFVSVWSNLDNATCSDVSFAQTKTECDNPCTEKQHDIENSYFEVQNLNHPTVALPMPCHCMEFPLSLK